MTVTTRFLTLNKVTLLQNIATESSPEGPGYDRAETSGSQGARESHLLWKGCLKPSRTNSSILALVPEKGDGFRGSGGPQIRRGGAGERCRGKGLTQQDPSAHRPASPPPAHLRGPALRVADSSGKCPRPGSRKLLGHSPPARTSHSPAHARRPDTRGRSPVRLAQDSRLPGHDPRLNPDTRAP